MKNLEHLPEKFAFKLDDLGKRWIRETFGTDSYDDYPLNGYFHYPNYKDNQGFKDGEHANNQVLKGYTLISTDKLFPQPQIPTIEKGVMMLVWMGNENLAVEREVMFFDGNFYYTKHPINTQPLVCWKNAKPIPQIPEFTIEEAEQKFNIKIKQECTQQKK